NQPGCGIPTAAKHCEKHMQKNASSDDAVDKKYHTAAWTHFRAALLVRNPQCQRLDHGEECRNAGKILHHLISPRVRADLFLTPSNVVALCADHHPSDDGT